MSIILRDGNGKEEKYDYIIDALRDIVDEDFVEEQLNEIYPPTEVEGHNFPVGTIFRRCGDDFFWAACIEDFLTWEADYLEDELNSEDKVDYWGYEFTRVNEV